MNNKDYGHITPELLDQVKAVLEDAANHKYSVSRIYGAHNQVFKLSETPESCASCLRKRASALKNWYGEYIVLAEDAKLQSDDEPKGAVVSPELVETFITIDGERHTVIDDETEQLTTVIFTPAEEGAAFGKATDVKGKPTPAYVYEQNGKTYLVTGDEGNYTEVTGEPIAEVKGQAPTLKLSDKNGNAVDAVFASEDGVKGTLNTIDGKALKPGTYTTAEGATYTVQPGGKATLKEVDNDLL